MRIAYFENCTTSEGPGKRFALWVQGCSIRCSGCINPELHSFSKGEDVSIFSIVEKIKYAKENYKITGISILGGEPFDQKEELNKLLICLKNKEKLELNTIVFTGYSYEQLKKRNDKLIDSIFSNTDVLIDGKYLEEKKVNNLYLRGSSNQKIIIFNDKVFCDNDFKRENSFDIKFDSKGNIIYTGFPFDFSLFSREVK